MVKTLNELAHLRDSGFGQPQPRHGLKLLYWFANDCVYFDKNNKMLSKCNPAEGDFGFHYFNNRCYGKKLIDDRNSTFYVVGNLNFQKYPKAKNLPTSVWKDKNTDEHDSNTDRIIVSLHNRKWFLEVYVTQHYNRSNNYDPDATYRISRGLLMIIRRKSLEDFLKKMGYYTYAQPVDNYSPQTTDAVNLDYTAVIVSSSDSSDSESPTTQNNDIRIQLDGDTPKQNHSENSGKTKGLWERYCTIL
ncbi:hypothetical protein QQF64_000374 [Cirrhinus molitorella]|uniref:Uncharacterized protein n=1 Tax=Cirrhinus molitorella TaxID=172907 RepID=A0ABR3NYB2_9TELE